jgi:hypothetical protein
VQIGPNESVDNLLDILQVFFQSSTWKQLPQEEKTRLIGRLSYILEITEKQELGD